MSKGKDSGVNPHLDVSEELIKSMGEPASPGRVIVEAIHLMAAHRSLDPNRLSVASTTWARRAMRVLDAMEQGAEQSDELRTLMETLPEAEV